jgi:pimeloyl-ACP methyl ester carboxylesterase
MKKLYCISGLGADRRMFGKLRLKNALLTSLPWPPNGPNDTIHTYAQKVSALIPDTKPIILGLSFGGMLAVEIARQRPVEKLFLISSAKTVDELPKPNPFILFLIRTGLLPAHIFNMPNRFVYKAFGAYTHDEKELISNILKDSDGHFMKWAFKALLYWDNVQRPENAIHIHGTADKIIPAANVRPDYWIEGGTHMMIYNRAAEVSRIIQAYL